MKKKLALLSAIFAGGVMLQACGGGSSTTTTGSTGTTVAGYITDVPADEFTVFEVTLYEIRLSDGTNTVTLFSDQNGVAVDLTDLKGVMKYIGSVQLDTPATFTTVEIVVDRNVNVKDATGNSSTVSFGDNVPGVDCDQTTGKCTIRVENLNIDTSSGKVAIDFDLAGFVVEGVQITSISIKHKDIDPTVPVPYEVTGVVKSVDTNNNSFVITWKDQDFTVSVDQNTVCEGMNAGCMPQENWCVAVEGSTDPASSSAILALEIERKKAEKCVVDVDHENGIADYDEDYAYIERKHNITDLKSVTISVKDSTITIDGNSYHIGDDTVCKLEVEGMDYVDTNGQSGNDMGTDDQNYQGGNQNHDQNTDSDVNQGLDNDMDQSEDRNHQILQQRYRTGTGCLTAINQIIDNIQNQNQSNMQNQPEIEIELKVDPNSNNNHVVKLELSVENREEN